MKNTFFKFSIFLLFIFLSTSIFSSPLVYMISYADRNEVHFLNQEALLASSEGKGIDVAKGFCYQDLDPVFCEKNKAILRQQRGAGYWLWKPWIILDVMNKLPENSVIIYVDSGATIISDLTPLVEMTLTNEFVLFLNTHTNLPYTKRDCFILMNCDTSKYYLAMQYQASMLFILNNESNRAFIAEWLNYCENPQILTDSKSVLGKESPIFKDHRHDQSVLSLLLLKKNKNFLSLPCQELSKYFYHHRRRNPKKPI